MPRLLSLVTLLVTTPLISQHGVSGVGSKSPNFVVFLADDLGVGDVGCFGNKTVTTPNIDRLSREGAKFTHHLATAPLCTPSRAAFMTGRYAIRMGMEQPPGGPGVMMYVSGSTGLPENETTWADALQRKGYATAAVGKWHLGWDGRWKGDNAHGPLTHGFQRFFGLPFTLVDGFEVADPPFLTYSAFAKMRLQKDGEGSQPLHNHGTALALSLLTVCAVYSKNFGYSVLVAMILCVIVAWFFIEHFALHTETWWKRSLFMEKFLNSVLMKDRRISEQPITLSTLTERLTEEAVTFVREEKDQPFALYFAFPNVHTPLVPGKKFRGKSDHGSYGDSIIEMDDAIGKVLGALDDLDLARDTFVLFASDHGSHIDLGRMGGSNRPHRGGKGMGAVEGGIRVPAVIRWPGGGVQPGVEIDAPSSLLDFLPTVLDIVQEGPKSQLDGKSYLPLLQGRRTTSAHRVLRHYCGMSLHALRLIEDDGRVLKAYYRSIATNSDGHCGYATLCPCFGHGVESHEDSPVIFDLLSDPAEESPLSPDSTEYAAIAGKLHRYFIEAESEVHPPSQYSSMLNVMPRPWVQPCARFPLCRT